MKIAKWAMIPGAMFEVAKSEITDADLDFASRYVLWAESVSDSSHFNDEQSPGMFAVYKDPVMAFLQKQLWPRMEEISGLSLLPTYSYLRVYRPGAILEKHKDRPACEISATLLLGTNQDEVWPLFIEGETIIQEVGEMVVYRGMEVAHWREPMVGPSDAYQAQLFLHYVDANGPYEMCEGDSKSLPLKPQPYEEQA